METTTTNGLESNTAPIHQPSLLWIVLFPQFMYFVVFCVIFWKWYCSIHRLCARYLHNYIFLLLLVTLSISVMILFFFHCMGSFHITLIIWSSALLFATAIMTLYSFISAKLLHKSHVNELSVTITFMFVYFAFQFILSLNFILSDAVSNESKITDDIILYIFSHVLCLLCVFRDVFTSKPAAKSANSDGFVESKPIHRVLSLTNEAKNAALSPVDEWNEYKLSSPPVVGRDRAISTSVNVLYQNQSAEDQAWSEYIGKEQDYLMNNVLYIKTINDAMPQLVTKKHAAEQRLIMILKSWIQYYGLPALMQYYSQWNTVNQLETNLNKYHKEADSLDEDVMQLTQKVFTLENDMTELNRRYTQKCDELDSFKRSTIANKNTTGLRIQVIDAPESNATQRAAISPEHDSCQEALSMLKKLRNAKSEEYQQAKRRLFKMSMDFGMSSPVAIDDMTEYIVFKVIVDDISLFNDAELNTLCTDTTFRLNMNKNAIVHGKYVNDKAVLLETGLYCSRTDVCDTTKPYGDSGVSDTLKPKRRTKQERTKSYKDIEMEVMRGIKLPAINRFNTLILSDSDNEKLAALSPFALQNDATSDTEEDDSNCADHTRYDTVSNVPLSYMLRRQMPIQSKSNPVNPLPAMRKDESSDTHLLSPPAISSTKSWACIKKKKSAQLLDTVLLVNDVTV